MPVLIVGSSTTPRVVKQLVDSGATYSFTSRLLLKSLNLSMKNAEKPDYILANGSVVACTHKVDLFYQFIAAIKS